MSPAFPNNAQYNRAILHLDQFTQLPQLAGAQVRRKRNNHNQPFVIPGGYSRVYPVELPHNRTVAVRVWTAEVAQAKRRYQQIATAFNVSRPPYFVPVEYHEQGLMVEGQWYPMVIMEWVNAPTLGKFLDQHIRDEQRLRYLAARFLEMCRDLHAQGISHGDVQDGNILVVAAGSGYRLVYIDYDTLHLPSMGTHNSFVLGVPNYQHPRRPPQVLGKTADHFSELVVYLSLLAYAEKPELWQSSQDMRLLFSASDYAAPNHSEMFKALDQLKNDDLRFLAAQLRAFCAAPNPEALPPLEAVVAQLPSARPPMDWAAWDDWFSKNPSDVGKMKPTLRPIHPPVPTPLPTPAPQSADDAWMALIADLGRSQQQALDETFAQWSATWEVTPPAAAGQPNTVNSQNPGPVPAASNAVPQAKPPLVTQAAPIQPQASRSDGSFLMFLLLLALLTLAVGLMTGVILLPPLFALPSPIP